MELGCYINSISINQLDDKRIVFDVHLISNNRNLLGSSKIHTGVFARYRQIQKEIYLNLKWEKRYVYLSLHLHLANINYKCESYPLVTKSLSHMISEFDLIKIDDSTVEKNDFIERIRDSVRFVLRRRRDDKIYLIEQSMYFVVSLLNDLFYSPIIIDIGSGSGNLACVALDFLNPSHLYMYELLPLHCHELRKNIKKYFDMNKITISDGDCIDIQLPNNADILCISVNPDVIVSFIHLRNKEIKDILTSEGMIIIFVGDLSFHFTNSLILDEKYSLGRWDWYEYVTPLKYIFKYVFTIEYLSELVAVGTDSFIKAEKLIEKLKLFGMKTKKKW